MAATITGVITALLLLLNTLILIGPMMLVALLKVILPGSRARQVCSSVVMAIAETWAEICKAIFALMTPTQWEIRGVEDLRGDTSYLVISNHQSWVDIPALIQAFNRKTPYFKFFLKKELIWVPFLGLAFWALDYPFMKRYSKAYLEKHPEKKGQDLETTRKACEKFKDLPTSVMNFLEGTRYTEQKHAEQKSEFKHLLKPKAGGMAFAMSAMGDQFKSILDVTIYYPDGIPTFWDFMQGKMPRCSVVIEEKAIPKELMNGDYEASDRYRLDFQLWVQQLWEEKDRRLETMRKQYN